ncbi:MAG: V-type ATP synthase subunit I [Ruminococcaceae bacterium]|nr:V-type ATP synthase subunit I [Oscillospiraceae bacterium]
MAIVRMKHLSVMAMASERKKLLELLSHIGVVEISETAECDGFSRVENPVSEKLLEELTTVKSAISLAKRYGSFKKGMFTPRPAVTEREFFDDALISAALSDAKRITDAEAMLSRDRAEAARLSAVAETYTPWCELDVPLDTPSGRFYDTTLATVPASKSAEDIGQTVAAASELSECFVVSADRELNYVFVLSFCDDTERVRDALKQIGGAIVRFAGVDKTAKEKISELQKEISELEKAISETEASLSVTEDVYDRLLAAHDALETRISVADAEEMGIGTERVFYIEGWCPAREEKMLTEIFEENGTAYEFRDPEEDEEPPTLTHSARFISPFETVTNMYSPPAYRGIDPNPTMAPFFAMFFGIMLSDAGYGLLLMLAGIFALVKMKPRGGFKNFMQLAIICGASTVLWGLLFGGFFGDAIPSVYRLFTGKVFPYETALWFNPTNDPMTMLIFSLILGGIQIVAGMAVKAYMMIRDGQVWDAIFDIGFWWVLFAGAITCIFNAKVGLYVLGAGALGLILTQGRAKKNIIGKFFSGVLSLYDITGYFSDILSYSRLLALSLSTAVVGNVINTMGILTGPIGFFVVFVIGHVFNIAINLVGSFVHSARLQYVEYFGKFYESGGRLFSPLSIKTKNIDVIKEEI